MTDQSSAVAVGMRSKTDADVLRGRRDDVEVAQVPLGVVQLEVQAQVAREVVFRDHVDVIDRLERVEGGERRAGLVGEALVALRARVAVAVVELVAADVGAERRLEVGERVDPGVGDLVDRRGRAC